MESLNDMIGRRDDLDRQISQTRAKAACAYADALDAIGQALEDWADAQGRTVSRSQRKYAETLTVDGAVCVVLGFPCEQCLPSLSVRWGAGVRDVAGTHATFFGYPPPAVLVAFIAALLTEQAGNNGRGLQADAGLQ